MFFTLQERFAESFLIFSEGLYSLDLQLSICIVGIDNFDHQGLTRNQYRHKVAKLAAFRYGV